MNAVSSPMVSVPSRTMLPPMSSNAAWPSSPTNSEHAPYVAAMCAVWSLASRYTPVTLRCCSTLWRARLKPVTTRTPDRLSDRSLSTLAIPSRTRL